jgi:oxaloacetate decarboxylase alpha subunit
MTAKKKTTKKKTTTKKATTKTPARKSSAKKTTARKATTPKKATPAKPAIEKVRDVRITDTTLRDAHQSLWATRMRSRDIMGIIDTIDNAGYYSLEVWGGATFDVCLRFLRENPWERLRMIKASAKKTPLQMLLRGQNILGYKHYPDDVLDRFVELACSNGIDIFRIFDALNDNRNLEHAIKAVNRCGGHAQGTICYTISPVHTVEEFVRIAREQVQMGIDSLVIKDMAGIMTPVAAEKLVGALAKEINIPIQLHSHATSGMAVATYLSGVRAGAGAIDCAISVMSQSTSQPPSETMLAIFEETEFATSVDPDVLQKICKYFENLAPKRRPSQMPINPIDPGILRHHIPGGMISNLRSQLQQQGALDRLPEVLDELPRTRADMGYPPLVTPTSQIVGVQSVINVLGGKRYGMITEETRNYVRGLYGRSPAAIDAKLKKKILGKEKPITHRPADDLEPMLPNATDNIEPGLIQAEEDIISYCLFPEVALGYFKWRDLPTEDRPTPPADLENAKRDEARAEKSQQAEPTKRFLTDDDYAQLNHLVDRVNAMGLNELTIRRNDLSLSLKGEGNATAPVDVPAAPVPAAPAPAAKPEKKEEPKEEEPTGPTLNAPLTGTFYRTESPEKPELAKEGDKVKKGQAVCAVEAMKLVNKIEAPENCTIVKFLVAHGSAVEKGQPLVAYKPA